MLLRKDIKILQYQEEKIGKPWNQLAKEPQIFWRFSSNCTKE
jgi:hypothetical protein